MAQPPRARRFVLTHLVPGDAASEKIFLERASKSFKGEIVVGRDLMKF